MTTACPDCYSKAYKRNGFTRHGKQNHRCLDCGRQFSVEPGLEFVIDFNSKFPGRHAISIPAHIELEVERTPIHTNG